MPVSIAASGPASSSRSPYAAFAAPAPQATVFFTLADGTRLEAVLRRSARARRPRLTLTPAGDLLLVVPQALTSARIEQHLPQFLPWLERAWRKQQSRAPVATLPERIVLPLPDREYLLEIAGDWAAGRRQIAQAARAPELAPPLLLSAGARRLLVLEEPGRLRLFGSVDDPAVCALALRRWCRETAARLLPPYLAALAAQGGFALAGVSVRDQRSRWGSCARVRATREQAQTRERRPPARSGFAGFLSALLGDKEREEWTEAPKTAGRISLNWRAALLPVPLLEHLCWHELCHLRQMNHSPAYRAELARFSPHWPEMEKALNKAWREMPWWALPAAPPAR